MSAEHYAEEQQSEIEILQSIYPTEFVEESQDPWRFSLTILIDDADDIRPCSLQLGVEYTPTYPDALPIFSITLSEEGNDAPIDETDAELSDKDLEYLTDRIRETGEESLGMAMVFSMASSLKELATERLVDKTKELKRLKEERIQKEIEADQAKFIGTPVTKESFMEWRTRFDAEMELAARNAAESEDTRGRKMGSGPVVKKDAGKLTGRQLFEQDKTLAVSDSRFISEGDVSVDTSAFPREKQEDE
ncbi:rwd domain-containing protein [Coemansia sp. Benny D115]|nr:rwd domain-containing protein [Coemansia sp. Benny D115]